MSAHRKYLDGVKARADAATKCPWSHSDTLVSADGKLLRGVYVCSCATDEAGEGVRDAAFIAAARSDVPKLVRIVEALAKAHKENAGFFNTMNYQASERSQRSEEALFEAERIAGEP